MRPRSAEYPRMQCASWMCLTGCIRRLLRLSTPIVLQNMLQYSLVIISTAFVGHLGDPTIMSGAVLAGSFFNVTGYTVIVGLAGAMDTLCGQVRCADASRHSLRHADRNFLHFAICFAYYLRSHGLACTRRGRTPASA
jgi:Na+-driven multidrug efflux pump